MSSCPCGVEGRGTVTKNLMLVASALEERSGYQQGAPNHPPPPNPHECCQSFKLPPVVLILRIHHLVYQFLSLRVISQLLTLGILYFGLSEHMSVYRYWLLCGRAGLNYFSTVDPFVKSGVGWGRGGGGSYLRIMLLNA